MKQTDKDAENKAIRDYRKMSYDLAKIIGRLSDIYDRMQFIDQQCGWNGMHEIDFEKALAPYENDPRPVVPISEIDPAAAARALEV